MAYNTKSIVTDKDGNPISQYYNPDTDSYEPVEGSHGANKVMVGNNDLSLILDKLSQLTGTIIDEEIRKSNENTRKSNEDTRKSNELQRIDNEEIRIQNENTRVQNENIRQTNEDTRIVNENARVLAEQERATTFAGYENRVTNVENDLAQHKLDYMPHRFQDLKNDKIYKFGFQINEEGNPQIIYEEVM